MELLLYSYCTIFHLDPSKAKHTRLSDMMDMIHIHGEIEKFKSDEMESRMKKK